MSESGAVGGEGAMVVRVLFFGVLADRAGVREVALELRGGASVGAALDALSARYAEVGAMREKLAVAVNLEYVKGEHVLHEGDEVAVIPPVSGG